MFFVPVMIVLFTLVLRIAQLRNTRATLLPSCQVPSMMDGKEYQAGKFAFSLRSRLFRYIKGLVSRETVVLRL